MPAASLEAAREAADTFARFMAENADEFGREIEFVFERRVSVPLSKMLIYREAEKPCSEHTAQILQLNSSPLLVKRGSWQVYVQTYGLSSAGAVLHLGQGHGYVAEHWEDITSQETIGHLVGTRSSHLIGF